ncbi:unnamed protein product [Toxocara canis]|uniref:BESS domain-containing protein n=1 Tax=Toxocara canis TaxID=6265 RepID=A0A183VBM5_TOXCA|nr:unnamed protein product [Toxocara canis]
MFVVVSVSNAGTGLAIDLSVTDANGEPYYGQPPLSFYCEAYPPPEGAPPAALPHPSFIIPPDAHHMHIEQPANEATYMEDSLRPPHSSPNMPLAAQVSFFSVITDHSFLDKTPPCNDQIVPTVDTATQTDRMVTIQDLLADDELLKRLIVARLKDPVYIALQKKFSSALLRQPAGKRVRVTSLFLF